MRDTSTAMLVAVKQVPSWWMQENQSKFRSVYPYETEMPWMDVAYLAFLNQVGYHWACSLLGVYRDDTCTYIVTSLASHGDLFLWSSRLQMEPGPTREATVQPLAVQMLKAVQELHDLSIAHRDLSCENILVTQVDDILEVRVIDFAAACGSRFSSGAHGKDMYVAPEVHLGGKFDTFLSDAFALGVIFLSVLLQRYPWNSTKPGCCKSFEYVRKHGLRKCFGQHMSFLDIERQCGLSADSGDQGIADMEGGAGTGMYDEHGAHMPRAAMRLSDGTKRNNINNNAVSGKQGNAQMMKGSGQLAEKPERDRLRQQVHGADAKDENEPPADEDDVLELWQWPTTSHAQYLEDDVTSFMERPGLTSQEYVDLINGGIPAHLARWEQGRKTGQKNLSSLDPGMPDTTLCDANHNAKNFGMNYFVGNSNHVGHVVMLADLQPSTSSRPRSRSRPRMSSREQDDDVTALMDLGGRDAGRDGGEGDESVDDARSVDGGTEGEHPDSGSEAMDAGVATAPPHAGAGAGMGPPPFLGPMSLSALQSAEDRHYDLFGEEQEFADRAWLIEQAVRSAMYGLSSGSAREVVRRLLLRQQHLAEIQYWLNRALQQALRCCPAAETDIHWDVVRNKEDGIWGRILGLEGDDPMVQRLRAASLARVRRREVHHRTRGRDPVVHLTYHREPRRTYLLLNMVALDLTFVIHLLERYMDGIQNVVMAM
ncbi:KCC4 [Symbiodinium sp. CCMP2592]|nr:KCC4 [Symbiodinium sp. CCMP2592]